VANKEHLRTLKQGVETWNQWRQEHPEIAPDLSRARLRGVNLCGADLSEADVGGVDLSGSDLEGVDLSRAHLDNADLRKANLTKAKLMRAHLVDTNLKRATLVEADLFGAHLDGTELDGADLTMADLTSANLELASLDRAKLVGTRLVFTLFPRVQLRDTDFTGAALNHTVFAEVNLSAVKGLDSVIHSGPSTIGVDTIHASQGRIPEVFLRGAGVPDALIAYARSLVGRPNEFYSCFISYSSRDQDFAERLHADLQSKGVRCWFAPEDMKIGDKIWDRLDRSIRLHDKLLLILSANSIGSEWVEDEVTTAFEEERKRGKTVLFPVRVDDSAFATDEPWAAKIRQRHIGDFSQWRDHGAYKKTFDRLLRDLKAENQKPAVETGERG